MTRIALGCTPWRRYDWVWTADVVRMDAEISADVGARPTELYRGAGMVRDMVGAHGPDGAHLYGGGSDGDAMRWGVGVGRGGGLGDGGARPGMSGQYDDDMEDVIESFIRGVDSALGPDRRYTTPRRERYPVGEQGPRDALSFDGYDAVEGGGGGGGTYGQTFIGGSRESNPHQREHSRERRANDVPKAAPLPVTFEADGVPYVEAPIYGAADGKKDNKSVNVKRASSVSPAGHPRMGDTMQKVYHTLRSQMIGSVERSEAMPSKPPPPASCTQFQLATESNPFHVLAIQCNKYENLSTFSVVMDDLGYVYVRATRGGGNNKSGGGGDEGARARGSGHNVVNVVAAADKTDKRAVEDDDGFELLMQFPTLVDELSAQSVYKDNVLFVIATPRTSNVVTVEVDLEPGQPPDRGKAATGGGNQRQVEADAAEKGGQNQTCTV